MIRATRYLGLAILLVSCAEPPPSLEPTGAASPVSARAFALEQGALTAQLDEARLEVSVRDGALSVTTASATLGLETMTLGCDAQVAGTSEGRADGERVELARGGATEWLETRVDGLEHGFTFAERPSCPTGSLSIDLRVSGGLVARLESATRVVLSDGSGIPQLAYGALAVRDADGAAIPAHFALEGDRIRIIVDDAAARYPLVVDPLITNEQVRLNASDGVAGDQLGYASAVSGNTLVVGAPQVGAADTGAVYVFVRSGTTWTQEARIAVAGSDHFGWSVAIDGDTLVVGGPETNSFAGEAWVFTRTGTTWTQQATLHEASSERVFGYSVAVHGDTAIVGAPGQAGVVGTVYMFTRVGIVWTRTDTFSPSNANPGMDFGWSVAFDGNTILVGAPFSNEGGVITGAAYAFGRDTTCFIGSWREEAHLTGPTATMTSRVGDSVAVDNGTALVAASGHTFVTSRGTAYVFTRVDPGGPPCPAPTISWPLQQQLDASDAHDDDRFASSVALMGDRAVLGATGVLNGTTTFAGAGYYFTRTGTVWTERTKLIPTDAGQNATGSSAAIGDTFVVLGANAAPRSSTVRSGAAYVFDTSHSPNGSTCAVGTDCSSGFCADGFCCNAACGASDPNDCQACSVAAGATTNGTCGALATGHACSDGSMCTTGDACNAAGACAGTASACAPIDACHTAACSPTTGVCTQTVVADGVACSDGDGCTTGDSCMAGVCTSGTPRVCTATDTCHMAGVCDPSTGVCSNPARANGTVCSDANACTQVDTCQSGVCTGGSPVACGALDMCHAVGVCNPATGVCTNPSLADGVACDDGNGCTTSDACHTGVCGGTPTVCTAGVCQIAGTCVAGACTAPTSMPDGTTCPMGMCSAGSCVFPDGGMMPDGGHDAGNDAGNDAGTDAGVDAGSDAGIDAGTDAAIAHDAGPGTDASARDGGARDGGPRDGAIDASPDTGTVTPPVQGGCGCTVPSRGGSGTGTAFGLALVAIVITRRRTMRRR